MRSCRLSLPLLLAGLLALAPLMQKPDAEAYLAPVAIRSFKGGAGLVVLGPNGRRAILINTHDGTSYRTVPLPAPGSGLAVRGMTAYVTTLEPAGRVLELDLETGAIRRQYRVGHTPGSPVLSPDGRLLYVANRFDQAVICLDLRTGARRAVPVVREPVALALSLDGKRLFVANHLPCVRPFLDDENPFIAAEISVIDTDQGRVIKNIELPNGSQGLRGIALSPDGRRLLATHVLSHYTRPTLTVEKGAMNMNAVSLLNAETLDWIDTVPLDDPNEGAANPWAVAFSKKTGRLLITHAGTDELSVIDYAALLNRLASRKGATGVYTEKSLTTLAGIRNRSALGIVGARAVLEIDGIAYVPGFFSDTLAIIDLNLSVPVRVVPLGEGSPPPARSGARLGEQYFNDAKLCFQGWQSCATCHPDGRSDALYWDLLNDGIGNTKNTKSLLLSPQTPPSMWRGVRRDAAEAVLAGIHHIQFAHPDALKAEAVLEYLSEMKPVSSPYRNADLLEARKAVTPGCATCHLPGIPRGTLSPSARRGKAVFEGKAGCARCHPHPYFTSLKKEDAGLGTGVQYDVPSLIEVWRTAPYLHSGDALTLKEAITDFNFMQKRGRTKDLSKSELEDLLAYLESL